VTWSYYLVFALPVAAIVLRDPLGDPPQDRWRGVYDGERMPGAKAIASGLVALATAFAVSRVLLPAVIRDPGSARTDLVGTSGELVPVLWIAAAIAVILAWWLPQKVDISPGDTRGTESDAASPPAHTATG
jgi:hypothetical protein